MVVAASWASQVLCLVLAICVAPFVRREVPLPAPVPTPVGTEVQNCSEPERLRPTLVLLVERENLEIELAVSSCFVVLFALCCCCCCVSREVKEQPLAGRTILIQ